MTEAAQRPTSGWDFGWLGDRMQTIPLPWDYTAIVVDHVRRSPDVLDLGTGGGEWLAALPHRPAKAVATEAWMPNLPVAARRLEPLGVEVVRVDAVSDNVFQQIARDEPRLPFADESFHLVVNRHESFVAGEVTRVLAGGGRFITQQLGDGLFGDFRSLFDALVGAARPWTLSLAVAQLEQAGLHITESSTGNETVTFRDVGALAWYLRMIPWTVPGFSIEAQRERLGELHQQMSNDRELTFTIPGFYLVAAKPVDHLPAALDGR